MRSNGTCYSVGAALGDHKIAFHVDGIDGLAECQRDYLKSRIAVALSKAVIDLCSDDGEWKRFHPDYPDCDVESL